MEGIEKALGKSKEYEINGIKVRLKPLKVKNLDLLFKLRDDKEKVGAFIELISIYAKQAFPDATEEQISELDFDFVNKLVECAMDVNDLNEAVEIEKKKLSLNANKK